MAIPMMKTTAQFDDAPTIIPYAAGERFAIGGFGIHWKIDGAAEDANGRVGLFVDDARALKVRQNDTPEPIEGGLGWAGVDFGHFASEGHTIKMAEETDGDVDMGDATDSFTFDSQRIIYLEIPEGEREVSLQFKVAEADGGTLHVKDRVLRTWIHGYQE